MPPPHTQPTAPPNDYRSPLPYLAVLLLAIGAAISFSFTRWHEQQPGSCRNPHFKRAWLEHVRTTRPKAPGEKLVVLIGNSQGYAKELEDHQTYARLLEGRLNSEDEPHTRIVNWSLFGGRAPEHAILAASAHRLEPDVVISLLTPRNFHQSYMYRRGKPTPLRSFQSDVKQLVGYADVRRHLPRAFRRHFIGMGDIANGRMARFWHAWRHRDFVVQWLTRFKPARAFIRYADEPLWTLKEQPRRVDRITPPLDAPDVNWDLVDLYTDSLKQLPCRTIFAFMPLHSASREQQPDVVQRFHQSLERSGLEVWDLVDTVPDAHFITVTHLDEDGHERMARQLQERLGL